jgi:hypothetical protein
MRAPEAGQRPPGLLRRRADLIAGVLIFLLTLSIFLASKVHQVADSNYSMLLSQSLLDHQSFMLDHYAIPRYEPVWQGDHFQNGPLYHLEVVDGHLYYMFPPGTSVLSVPFVAVMNLFGVSAANADGTYNLEGEGRTQVKLAALLMAMLAVLFYWTARLVLPVKWSIWVAVGGALGTQVYSTASRALWSETWGIFLLGVVVLLMVGQEVGRWRGHPVILASVLSWMYFVRPTYAVHIMAISVYMLIYHRKLFLRYAATGAVWLAGFIFYSWYHFRTMLPGYYRAGRLQFEVFWEALAGNLVSPSRGLLVYIPALFFVAYLLMRYRRHLKFPRLALLALSIVVGQLLLVSGFIHWWGGSSFGPRFMTGLVPWFVLLAILGVKAMLAGREQQAAAASFRGWKAETMCGVALLLLSVFINTRGATDHATWLWNQNPLVVDEHPERLWDWRQPQFLAGWLPIPPPRTFPPGAGRVDFAEPDAERYMWYGWGMREQGLRRTTGKEAALVFSLNRIDETIMRMKLGAFVVPGKHDEQRVNIALNGQHLQALSLKEEAAREYDLVLPKEMLRQKNVLTLELPDAVSPKSLGQGDDTRPLGMTMHWMEFQAGAAATLTERLFIK